MTILLLVIGVAVTANAAKAADPAEAAFGLANKARKELYGDEQKKKFRHHWQNVARRLETVAEKYPHSPRAQEAVVLAAQMYEQLARLSQNSEDADAARRLYARSGKAPAPVARSVRAQSSADEKKGGAAQATAPSSSAAAVRPRSGGSSGPTSAPASKLAAGSKGRAEKASAPVAARVAKPERAAAAAVAPSAKDAKAEAEDRLSRISEAFRKLELSDGDGAVADEAAPVADAPGLHVPSMEELAEKLRDVRVGAREVKSMRGAASGQELSLSEQLGLKVKRVIIDAGHGGHDTGAIGRQGTKEKDVALKIALKLAKLLTDAGLEVLLTRDDDTFVRLEDRTAFANKNRGDLFISVHCNSAPTKTLRGVETYTLNTSSDRYNIRLAARENAHTERGVGDLQLILADLATKANTEESNRLANRVQRELVDGLKADNPDVRDLGHKEALFFVLLGAKMPAILVETSFLSHPTEERLLSSDEYQEHAAAAIARGVEAFLSERSRLAQVD